jgi:LmbE family N-acetylglucosaminyl deacetylase
MRTVALALACSVFAASAAAPVHEAPLPAARLATGSGERVLIVAPHPDDEILCCAGFAQRAIASGARVGIVWITSGDAFELDAALVERTLLPGHKVMRKLATDRMQEANAAAGQLGIAPTDRWFLGYPDRGIRRLLTDFYARPYTSHYTGAAAVPYDNALAPRSPYEGRLLERDLVAVLDRVRPTLVLAPSPLDRHSDHAAIGELVRRLMSTRGSADGVRYWIVHGGRNWPTPRRYLPAATLQPPASIRALDWSIWPLTAAERDTKLAILRLYRSQWRIMEPFLASFVRGNELFAEPSPLLE